MKFAQALKMALVSITSSKMRSFLTMLGIIIGVISVTMLVSIAQSSSSAVTGSISDMGSTLLTVNIRIQDDIGLTLDSLNELTSSPYIQLVAPSLSSSVTAKAESTTYSTTLKGGTADALAINNLKMGDGRFINEVDLEYQNQVAVIGTDVAENLYATRNCVGNYVEVNGKNFLVVGVLAESGSSASGSNNDQIIIPFTTANKLLDNKTITTFSAVATSADTVDQAQTYLETYLYQLTGSEDDFRVFNESSILETMASVTDTLALMLGGIAAISLLVGGIGIMNIMLVSVSERTREIGIRKSIGAKRRDILSQFLIEAMTLSILGGFVGVLLGFIGIKIASIIMNKTMTISLPVAAAAVIFSVIIGIAFGLYPASKASKLNPIDALRYE